MAQAPCKCQSIKHPHRPGSGACVNFDGEPVCRQCDDAPVPEWGEVCIYCREYNALNRKHPEVM